MYISEAVYNFPNGLSYYSIALCKNFILLLILLVWGKKTSSSIPVWESPGFKNCDEESPVTVAPCLHLKVNCKTEIQNTRLTELYKCSECGYKK